MNFNYIEKYDDPTGRMASAKRRCDKAMKYYSGDYGNFPDRYNMVARYSMEALMKVIKDVYAREEVEQPKKHKSNYLADADYMWDDSGFAVWLKSKTQNWETLLKYCNDIRDAKNVYCSHNDNEAEHGKRQDFLGEKNGSTMEMSRKMAESVLRKLDEILNVVCNNFSGIHIRAPRKKHLACVILLDISGSMLGTDNTPIGKRPIDELNKAPKILAECLSECEDRVQDVFEFCFITFNESVEINRWFRNVDNIVDYNFQAGGRTSFNTALEKALDVVEKQKKYYRSGSTKNNFYRPWIWVISDGVPTDTEKEASVKKKMHDAIDGAHILYYPLAVGDKANISKFKEYYPDSWRKENKDQVFSLDPQNIKDAFQWLANSIVSSIKSGDENSSNFAFSFPGGINAKTF